MPARAHHGWREYDSSKALTLTGKILESGDEHPHGHVRLETPGKTWHVVRAPPSRMENRGLAPAALKTGATVTVVGYANREKPGERRAERITAGTVLWAAGVAASPLVRTLGAPLDRAGRAIVESDVSIPGHPEVFVAGDAAVMHGAGGRQLPGVAQTAMQQAAHAAQMILRRIAGKPSTPFVYRDLGNMAIVGRGSAIADLNWLHLSGPIAWLAWLFLHIVMLIGFRNRVVVLLQWAVAYFTYQRSVRLITNTGRSTSG